MATRKLNVVISGDARQLGVATSQADDHMKKVEASSGRMGKALKVGFGAAAAGAGLLVVGLKQSIDAAMDAEKSNARLQAQLKASGISYRAHAKEIENVIQKTSQLAALDDEDLQDAFTNLVRSTGNVKQSLKDMALVADLARAKNLDVARAGDLIAKVHAGNTGVLRRYGIQVNQVTVETDALKRKTDAQVDSLRKSAASTSGPAKAAILDRIKDVRAQAAEELKVAKAADKSSTAQGALASLQNRFKGQAEAYGKTAAGAQERFQVAVENLKEMLGAKLLPIVTKVTNAVSKFVNEMQTGTGAGGGFARSMGEVADSLRPVATATASVVGWFHKHEKAANSLATAIGAPMQQLRGLTSILKGLKAAGDAVVSAFKSVASVIGKVGGVAKDVGGALNPFGDGLGKIAASNDLPAGGAFGGSLKGAQTALRPFAAIGSRFGLSVTSGRRPGSITSSGNISYHSSGEAIDMGDGRGPDANKLNFFRYMKQHFGGRLAELIYTPGGQGIKDGRPYKYSGQVAADHYDHVHVAFDTGKPGVGDGLGKFTATAYGPPWGGIQGTGVTATGVNLKGAPHTYGVAVDPSVIPLGSKLKITPNPFGYSGAFTAFDTGGAIKGKRIDFYDWRGRKAQLGWGMQSVSVETVSGGSSKDSGSKKSKPRVPTLTPGGNIPTKPPTYEQIDTALGLAVEQAGGQDNPAAVNALVDQRRALSERATKIRAALRRKDLKPATRQRLQAELAGLISTARGMDAQIGTLRNPTPADTSTGTGDQGDPNQPLIDAQNAAKEAADALRDQLKEVQKSIDAQTDFAKGAANTSNYQLTKTLADILSGHIVGRGVAGRAFTPGSGVEYAY